ncbi:MAG: hypothetical protein QW331_03125 [Candidatus Woesearchaeota archaeon]
MGIEHLVWEPGERQIIEPTLEHCHPCYFKGGKRVEIDFTEFTRNYWEAAGELDRKNIILSKKLAKKSLSDVVRMVARLGEHQRAIIPASIEIVPEDFDTRNWLKRHATRIHIANHHRGDIQKIMQQGPGPYEAFCEAFEKEKQNFSDRRIAGVQWRGVMASDYRSRVALLSEWIKGAEMFYEHVEGEYVIESDKARFGNKQKFAQGKSRLNLRLQSVARPENPLYKMQFRSVPVVWKNLSDKYHLAVWRNIEIRSSIDLIIHDAEHQGTDDIIFGKHDSCGFFDLRYEHRKAPLGFYVARGPFFLPTENLYDFWMTLLTKTLREYRDNKGKLKRRSLSDTEKEVLVCLYAINNGFENSFSTSIVPPSYLGKKRELYVQFHPQVKQ